MTDTLRLGYKLAQVFNMLDDRLMHAHVFIRRLISSEFVVSWHVNSYLFDEWLMHPNVFISRLLHSDVAVGRSVSSGLIVSWHMHHDLLDEWLMHADLLDEWMMQAYLVVTRIVRFNTSWLMNSHLMQTVQMMIDHCINGNILHIGIFIKII